MTPATIEAKQYLTPPAEGFWKWSDEGDAVVWSNGKTIAFRSELEWLLVPFADEGFPPLGAILLLVSATRNNWELCPTEQLQKIAGNDRYMNQYLPDVIRRLNSISRLDEDVRVSMAARHTLIEVAFESFQSKISAEVSHEVIRLLQGDILETIVDRPDVQPYHASILLRQDIRALREMRDPIDSEMLRMCQATGLPQLLLPFPIELNASPGCSVRQQFAQWENDPELGGVIHATRQLLPMVTLPRPIQEQDVSAQGGVSDITNRGPLDRLLLSELANDDLTLAVRIALNEAMFLRRESPPKSEDRRRLILLDCGIRMWGIPRVMATALALAWAVQGDRGVEVLATYAEGKNLVDVDLTTRDGLVRQMKVMQPQMDVGAALPQFEKWVEQAEGIVEKIVVTSEEALEDPVFSGALAQSDLLPVIVATVQRDGQCRLFEITRQGRKPMKQTRIDIGRIAGASPSLVDPKADPMWPAILSVSPFPIRSPHAGEPKQAWCLDPQRAITILRDGRLLLWTSRKQGGLQLSDQILPASLFWHSEGSGDIHHVVLGKLKTDEFWLLKIDLATGVSVIDLRLPQPPHAFCSHGSALLAQFSDYALEISLELGTPTGSRIDTRGLRHVQGRFYQGRENWFALSTEAVENINVPLQIMNQIVAMFECDAIEGPIGVLDDGRLYFTATDQFSPKLLSSGAGMINDVQVGQGGRTILLKCDPDKHRPPDVLVDVLRQKATGQRYQSMHLEACEARKLISERSMRNRFEAVSITTSGELVLVDRKGRRFAFQANLHRGIFLAPPESDSKDQTTRSFEPIESPSGTRIRWKVATFEDGSQVFLDSRGLLHLKSSDPLIAESTFALSGGQVAGWSSTGRRWGTLYYLGEELTNQPNEFYEETIEPFTRHCMNPTSTEPC